MKNCLREKNRLVVFLVLLMFLSLVSVACGNKDLEVGQKEKQVEVKEDIVDADTGLVYESSLNLKYAESFSVDYYEAGYKKITDWSGTKILIVPEGGQVPEVDKSINIIQQPIDKVGAFSTPIATEMKALGLLDKIKLLTTAEEKWQIEEIRERMADGRITYAGKNSSPDYEMIQEADPDLIILTAGTAHGGDETLAKFDELGISWLGYGSQRESDPRGRLEWIKLLAVIFNEEEEAESLFDGEIKKIEELEAQLKESETERLKFATAFYSGDTFYVRNKGDYEVKMMELAGGNYIFSQLKPNEDGNTKMNAEELYKGAEEADILFYNNINGPSIQTVEDLVANAAYLGDIKAVKDGNVWGFKPHYYQSSDKLADIISDLYTILNSPRGQVEETEYYFLMK